MSFPTLMVYMDAADQTESAVRIAAGLADRFNATLVGLSALELPPQIAANGFVLPETVEADIERARTRLADKGIWFRKLAGADHRKIEWRSLLDFPTDALAREARAADLIVIRRTRASADSYAALDPGGAILKVGRPVLTVPDEVATLRCGNAVIGWKDGREAQRAVQDALPFLHEADRVTIAEICQHGEEDAACERLGEVSRYLTRHRINSGPRVVLHQDGSGAAALIRLARDEGADLLVTGAYGHSRLGEWIFGGVTRDLLATSPICCLMSH
jgi:nucleotide-binding universal stress UspA family protein